MTILTEGHIGTAPKNRRSVASRLSALLGRLLNRMAGYPSEVDTSELSMQVLRDMSVSGELDMRATRRSPTDYPLW